MELPAKEACAQQLVEDSQRGCLPKVVPTTLMMIDGFAAGFYAGFM
jgi:hypothetical protein